MYMADRIYFHLIDTSYTSSLITPTQKLLRSSHINETRAKHRHTICCGSMPTTGSDTSFFKFNVREHRLLIFTYANSFFQHGSKYQSPLPFTSFNSDTSFLGPWEHVDSLHANSQHRIRIVEVRIYASASFFFHIYDIFIADRISHSIICASTTGSCKRISPHTNLTPKVSSELIYELHRILPLYIPQTTW